MLAENKRNANLGVGIGFVLLVLGRGIQVLVKEMAMVSFPFLLAGLGLFAWGCFNYMKGKGHSQWLGLLGLTFVGLIIMAFLPDKHKDTASEKKGVSLHQASPETPPRSKQQSTPPAELREAPPPSQRHAINETDHYYQMLGLKLGATEEEVVQAYKDLVEVWNPDRFPQDLLLQQQARERLKEINEASDKVLNTLASSPKERWEGEKEQSTTPEHGDLSSARTRPGQPPGPPHRFEPASVPSTKSKAKSPLLAEVPAGVVVLVSLSVLVAAAIMGWYLYTSIPSSPSGQGNPTAARFNNFNSSFAKAVAHYQQGQLDEAIEDYSSVISSDPNSARAYAGRGDAYYKKGLYGLAVWDYDKAMEISREPIYLKMHGFACYNRGIELYEKSEGRLGTDFLLRAKSDLDRVLSGKSDDAETYYYRGVATCLVGITEYGLSDIKTAARLGYKPAQKYLTERGYRW